MALNKVVLQADIQAALTVSINNAFLLPVGKLWAQVCTDLASSIATAVSDAVDTYVKTATVNVAGTVTVPMGIPLAGTCPAGPVTGATTGPGSLIGTGTVS